MHEQQPNSTPFEPKPAASEHESSHGTPHAEHQAPQHHAAAPSHAPTAPKHVEPNRVLAALSYLSVLFLFPLLVNEDDEFVRFHLRQGLVLFALEVVASFGFHYRNGGSLLMFVLGVIALIGAVRALRSEKWLLPVIGQYAQRIKL